MHRTRLLCLSLILCLHRKCVWSHIYLDEQFDGCYGIYCNNDGTLYENANCTCVCAAGFTGHFCDTEMRSSLFPRGQYALPATRSGCPEENDAYGWHTGYINLTVIGSNMSRHYWSDNIHLLDFEDGFIHLENYKVSQGMYGGTLPEMKISTDDGVTLYFCCRQGNNSNNDVIFGGSSWFFLFKGSDTDTCLHIAGMSGLPETFAFRKDRIGTWPISGSVPFHEEDDEFFNLTFCFFKLKVEKHCMYDVDKGASYRGNHSEARGKECDYWSEVKNLDPRYAGDLEENYCRRLSKLSSKPICYERGLYVRGCKEIPSCVFFKLGRFNFDHMYSFAYHFQFLDYLQRKLERFLEYYVYIHRRLVVPYSQVSDLGPSGPLVAFITDPKYTILGYDESVRQEDTITRMKNVAYLKHVDVPPGFTFSPDGEINEVDHLLDQQLVVNGRFGLDEEVNFQISTPIIEPYIKVDLGFSHEIYGVLIHRKMLRTDPNTYWQRMVVWISRNEWDFLTFGAYTCGDMVNTYKNEVFFFECVLPLKGRFVTLQTNVYSDPDVVADTYLNLQLNEILIYGKDLPCGQMLGLMSGEVTASQITTSSYISGFHGNQSRLNEDRPGWCHNASDNRPFLQVHLLLPMLVEGVIVQGWFDPNDTVKFTRSFKVLYGLSYDNMTYFNDNIGTKIFYTMSIEENNLTQTFWFTKPFLARVVEIELPEKEGSCLKLEWIVCKRRVDRDCANIQTAGWQSFENRDIADDVQVQKIQKSSKNYEACLELCRDKLSCEAVNYNIPSQKCRRIEDKYYPPFLTCDYKENRGNSITQKLCFEEIGRVRNRVLSSEAIITSPNYPNYYGEHTEYTWQFYFPDAVSTKVDILDLNFYSKTKTMNKRTEDVKAECYDKLTFHSHYNRSNSLKLIASADAQTQHQGSRFFGRPQDRIIIKFVSCYASQTMPYRGFALKVSPSDCPNTFSTSISTYQCGYIQSFYFPSGMLWRYNLKKLYQIRGSNYEYVKLRVIHYHVPEKEKDLVSFVDIPPDSLGSTVNIIDAPATYPVYYSRTSYIDIFTKTVTATDKRGFQLRYSFIKMDGYSDSLYQSSVPECESDWMYFKNSCYLFAKFYKGTFTDAQRECTKNSASLAIISSMEESNAINYFLLEKREFLQSEKVVFGLRSFARDKEFLWMDGSKAVFQNWYTKWVNGEDTGPKIVTEDACVIIHMTTSKDSANWIHQQCGADYTHAICEKRLGQKENSVANEIETMHYNVDMDRRTLLKPTFACGDTSLIDSISRCDRETQCVDLSDEDNCDHSNSTCGPHEFQCGDEQCIPMSRFCDFIIDCEDRTDESTCFQPVCKEIEFRCSNGECVPLSDRCDIKQDCLDGSDEINCQEVNCSHNGEFYKCADEPLCIPQSKVCDGFVDCLASLNSDESNCQHVMIKSSCKEWYTDGFRQSGTYSINLRKGNEQVRPFLVQCEFDEVLGVISTVIHHVNEGSIPYKDVLDVYKISYHLDFQSLFTKDVNIVDLMESMNMQCSQEVEIECYHAPDIGESVRVFGYRGIGLPACRLYKPDCVDGTDVAYCNVTECKCRLSQAEWLQKKRDVWYKDTFNIDNNKYLPIKQMRIKGVTLPAQLRVATGPLVCNSTMDRTKGNIKCNNGKVVPQDVRCLHTVDRYGSVSGCRDNTHLLNCETFDCPVGFAKCRNSYCIPLSSVCDNRMDCRFGEDELSCDTRTCPNQYRCRGSKACISLRQVCNGHKDCLLGDDETYCNTTCPPKCTCIGLVVDCSLTFSKIYNLTGFSSDTRKLNLDDNPVYFSDNIYFFKDFVHLGELSLSRCEILVLPNLIFSNLKNLYNLDLSFNNIKKISTQTLQGLDNLKAIRLEGNTLLSEIETGAFRLLKNVISLDLSGLSLNKIAENMFQGMFSLRFLNISKNKIKIVVDNAFKGLQSLHILDMQRNIISTVGKDSFAGLTSLSLLYTDFFMFCCIKPSSVDTGNCFPAPDEFSSCADLMRNEVLRVFLWIVGVFAFCGNILSFVFRFVSERDTLTCGYGILVTNLSVADMLMGIYLLMISFADASYRGRYAWNDISWRQSATCTTAGVIAIVSAECSVLILTLITFDRLKSIKYQTGLTAFNAISCCITVWPVAIMMAIIPVLPAEPLKLYFGDSFYSVSGVCLALPLTTKRMSGWGYSAGVLIVFNFLCFAFIVVGQSIIYITVTKTKIMLESPDRRIEFQMARRLSTIVITNFLTWCIICALGINALNGGTVSGDVYTWIAVFAMPLNSALNPIICTYSTFSNTQLGRRIMKFLGFQTVRYSSQNQVSAHLQNVHEVYKMKSLVLQRQKTHVPLKEYMTSADDVSLTTLVTVTGRLANILDKIHGMDLMVSRFVNENVLLQLGSNQEITELVIKALPHESKHNSEKSVNISDFGHVVGWMLKRYNIQKQRKIRPGASTAKQSSDY